MIYPEPNLLFVSVFPLSGRKNVFFSYNANVCKSFSFKKTIPIKHTLPTAWPMIFSQKSPKNRRFPVFSLLFHFMKSKSKKTIAFLNILFYNNGNDFIRFSACNVLFPKFPQLQELYGSGRKTGCLLKYATYLPTLYL